MDHRFRITNSVSRRGLLRTGVIGLAGLTSSSCGAAGALSRVASSATADSVIFINLGGGPSHLDTLDMKPDAPVETRGEFSRIQSKLPGLEVCEHMPQFAAHADEFTLIRGISHTTGDHPQGQEYIATGNRPGPAVRYPSYGSVVTNEFPRNPDLPSYIAIPQTEWSAGYMGDAFAPFKTNAVPKPGQSFAVRGITLAEGLTINKVNRRRQLLDDLDTRFREVDANSKVLEAIESFGDQAHDMITSTKTREAFDVNQEPQSIQKLFGADELGQSLLLATRLIEYGVRFITVTNQGWDTHLDNFVGHKRLIPPFDAGFVAIVAALREKGLLDRTLVVAMGEFGRTPVINANVGRDHYPRVNWCVMAGGGVQPGRLIGATNAAGTQPTDETDIQPDDLGASILHALGIDHHKEYTTRTGRPVSLIPQGSVIDGLF